MQTLLPPNYRRENLVSEKWNASKLWSWKMVELGFGYRFSPSKGHCFPHVCLTRTWQPATCTPSSALWTCLCRRGQQQVSATWRWRGLCVRMLGRMPRFASPLKFRWKEDKWHELIMENFKQVPQWLLSRGWSCFWGKEVESGGDV